MNSCHRLVCTFTGNAQQILFLSTYLVGFCRPTAIRRHVRGIRWNCRRHSVRNIVAIFIAAICHRIKFQEMSQGEKLEPTLHKLSQSRRREIMVLNTTKLKYTQKQSALHVMLRVIVFQDLICRGYECTVDIEEGPCDFQQKRHKVDKDALRHCVIRCTGKYKGSLCPYRIK